MVSCLLVVVASVVGCCGGCGLLAVCVLGGWFDWLGLVGSVWFWMIAATRGCFFCCAC